MNPVVEQSCRHRSLVVAPHDITGHGYHAPPSQEMDRLDGHIGEVRQALEREEPVGRRLDFLMQELNREANTLGSKSVVTDTTNISVELKVLIEQMREQVQNVE